jgi:signal transduction histidine kinase
MRFSTKIGLSATAAALLIGPLLGAAVFLQTRSVLLDRIVHEEVGIASELMGDIDQVLHKAADELKVIIADGELREFLKSPAEHQEKTHKVMGELEERAKLSGPWDGMYVFDTSGRAVFALKKMQSCVDTLNPLTRVAFDSALQGKAYRSDRIVCRRTGRLGIIFAEPIHSSVNFNQVVGVVMGEYAWSPIQDLLENVNVAATVHLFNSTGEMIGKRSTDRLNDNLRKHLRANATWKATPGGEKYAILADTSHGGENWLVLDSQPGTAGWTLMMDEPLKMLYAPITVLARNTGLLVLGVLLVTGGLFAILVRRFIRPLAELVEGVRLVEQGRFDQQVMVRGKDEFGELAGSFNTMVGTLQKTREELVRKEKLAMLGQVAGSVGHELRNPLGVMSNAVYYLQTVLDGSDKSVKEYLGIILAEITRSEHIIAELVDAVNTRSPERATHGVAELIGQIIRQCAVPDVVTVTLDIPETIPPLRVDARQMQQVLGNLISNGVEAMPGGGTLLIRALENRQEGTVRLSVQDSGSGMSPGVIAQLFQPLYTTKARGIGLGLVVAKNLTEINNGRIEVQSEPGKGSIFSIILPGEHEEGCRHG